jgi:8-oxo-dGTP diphosphatase
MVVNQAALGEQGFWLSMSTPLIVVAGLISKETDVPPFLLSRRLPDAHLGGYWEFPGGKLETGESPEAALRREIKEELDIEVEIGEIFAVGHHDYPTKTVLLLVYRALLVNGTPQCREVAEFAWLDAQQVVDLELPPADAPVVARLRREYL